MKLKQDIKRLQINESLSGGGIEHGNTIVSYGNQEKLIDSNLNMKLNEYEESGYDQEGGDIATEDHINWYQYGKLYHTGDEKSLRQKMDKDKFWPNVFFISDHGNVHQIELDGELKEVENWLNEETKKEPLNENKTLWNKPLLSGGKPVKIDMAAIGEIMRDEQNRRKSKSFKKLKDAMNIVHQQPKQLL